MLSKKEIVGIILLITALICILNAAVFGGIMPISSSYEQLAQQTISAGTAYICILYGLSTWLYGSHYAIPRREIRYVLISMLIVLILANCIGLSTVIKTQYMSQLSSSVKVNDLYTPFEYACRTVTLVFFVLTIVLLIVALIFVIMIAVALHNFPDLTMQNSNETLP
ncbi:uncharacterized protein LOC111594577 [Drosophila hydei]|uniref:Uncharacterized protein LOC111594577 n=1 Tax=Drosophila hydei TaxID=7224 RepID=A0A6J1LE87_DROHY|nr:uncharacterized protein LOC111594577 [Drosophila hydei]